MSVNVDSGWLQCQEAEFRSVTAGEEAVPSTGGLSLGIPVVPPRGQEGNEFMCCIEPS